MQKHNQDGSTIVVVNVVVTLLLIACAAFAAWAFQGRQDYKNNVDQKVTKAVSAAEAAQETKLKQQFAEESKNPNKTYSGSPTYGSVNFKYPKTWSAYVDETNNNMPINGYFHPDKVPGVLGQTAFALRVELVNTSYAAVIRQFDSQIKTGRVRAVAYVPPKMNGKANVLPGTRLNGAINQSQRIPQQGSMVVVQVRDKTLKISTQSTDYLSDFNNIVLASLSFVP